MAVGVEGTTATRLDRGVPEDGDRRIAALIFRARYVGLLALAVVALLLPALGDDRVALALTALLVGIPFNFVFDRWSARTGRVPRVMAWSEAALPALVAFVFPVVWTAMLVLVMANLSLHAVLFPRVTALQSTAVAAAAFALSGWLDGPSVWSIGVMTLLLYGVVTALAVSAVAEGERSARRRFTAIVDGIDAALFEADPASDRFTYMSHQIETLLGYTAEQWLSSPNFWLDHVHPDDVRRCVKAYTAAVESGRDFELEFRMMSADGRVVWFNCRVNVETDAAGRAVHLRGVAVDITERRRAEEALRYQALHDSLTGLPNRVLLQDRLRHAIATAERSGEPLGLLLLDLDQFKEINDTLGHDHGDRLLQQIGSRLRRVLRENDTIARLGGDEFAVIVPGADRVGCERVAGKIEQALEEPFPLEDMTVQARASVGIAVFPDQGTDAETLIQRADVAMYVAKRKGGGVAVYHPSDDRFSVRRLALIGELRRALEHDELELHFQPKLSARSREIIGVESLVRWRHPDY
ncbi:MAG TPA: diguanylate cyclase, partial [Acidimicrobiia bacterium]|nr:diguanylate cyclase [Acidimicrobiia bacterium]